MELKNYIQSYFGIVDEDSLEVIQNFFKPFYYKKGDFFSQTAKRCDLLCFVQEGLFRIYLQTPDKEITQWISTKGYFMTDINAFIFDTPARWNIQAMTNATVFAIRKQDYLKLATLVPQWYQFEQMFMSKCFSMMEDRIFSFLSLTAEERYLLFFEHNKELFNQVPLQYIASMLGMTPETFSRIRKKLAE